MTTICFTYPHGKTKCLTLSYDDARLQDRKLVELLNRYGLRATFHLFRSAFEENDERFIKKEEIPSLYRGHELACHLWNHPWVNHIPLSQLTLEAVQDRRFLEQYTEAPVRGLSYPYGEAADEQQALLRHMGFSYARTNHSSYVLIHPENFMHWDPSCHHLDPQIERLSNEFLQETSWIDMRLFYVWAHSYEFDNSNGWEKAEAFCAKMAHQEDVWYATNIEVCDYLTAVKNVVIGANGDRAYNPSAVSVFFRKDGQSIEIRPGETVRY